MSPAITGPPPLSRTAVSFPWATISWVSVLLLVCYAPLLKGDGPFLFAGEHMSYINGWQEGAVRSAHYALQAIASRMPG